MAKTKILKENFITRKSGWVQFYADDGSIQKLRSSDVEVVESLDDEQIAAEDSRRDFTAEEDAAVEAEVLTDEPEETSEGEDEPDAAPKASKPKRSGKPKETKMATKKAAKKAVKKAAKAASANTVRTIGGREHDISGYAKVKNAAGHTSFDNGDKVATTLRGKTLEEVYEIAAKKLGEPVKDLKARYKALNPGMQRMSLGNRLRKVMMAA